MSDNSDQSGEGDVQLDRRPEDVQCLIKQREELRIELEASKRLSIVLKKLINKLLVNKVKETNCLCEEISKTTIIFDKIGVKCIDLEHLVSDRNGHKLLLSRTNTETRNFEVSFAYQYRSYICKGCNKNLRKTNDKRVNSAKAYAVHCVKQCPEYEKLDLISHCFECKLSFLNSSSWSQHIQKLHRTNNKRLIKPKWMAMAVFKDCAGLNAFNTKIHCKGCKKSFDGRKLGSGFRIEFDYYVHCIKQCKEYKKLNLIRECKPCGLKFLRSTSLIQHNTNMHKSTEMPNFRTWMNKNMLNRKFSTEFNSTVNCKGCGRVFKGHMNSAGVTGELKYYIHCVEECEAFKKLNLIHKCNKCNKVYLSKTTFSIHLKKCT